MARTGQLLLPVSLEAQVRPTIFSWLPLYQSLGFCLFSHVFKLRDCPYSHHQSHSELVFHTTAISWNSFYFFYFIFFTWCVTRDLRPSLLHFLMLALQVSPPCTFSCCYSARTKTESRVLQKDNSQPLPQAPTFLTYSTSFWTCPQGLCVTHLSQQQAALLSTEMQQVIEIVIRSEANGDSMPCGGLCCFFRFTWGALRNLFVMSRFVT